MPLILANPSLDPYCHHPPSPVTKYPETIAVYMKHGKKFSFSHPLFHSLAAFRFLKANDYYVFESLPSMMLKYDFQVRKIIRRMYPSVMKFVFVPELMAQRLSAPIFPQSFYSFLLNIISFPWGYLYTNTKLTWSWRRIFPSGHWIMQILLLLWKFANFT